MAIRELIKKYGKVAVGVHFSVSFASITGLYCAIKSNVDVEGLLRRAGLGTREGEGVSESGEESLPSNGNRAAEIAAGSGGALALALLCNKALLPVRAPITVVLTPPVARFLRARKIIKA